MRKDLFRLFSFCHRSAVFS